MTNLVHEVNIEDVVVLTKRALLVLKGGQRGRFDPSELLYWQKAVPIWRSILPPLGTDCTRLVYYPPAHS